MYCIKKEHYLANLIDFEDFINVMAATKAIKNIKDIITAIIDFNVIRQIAMTIIINYW